MVSAEVKFKKTPDDGFSQMLSFPLRVTKTSDLPLPLVPRFIHFEDPEYNRQLSSTSAHAEGTLTVTIMDDNNQETQVDYLITLSSDRKEYNPDSTIAFRFDCDDVLPDTVQATMFPDS